jgi:hypothetical protein
MLTSLSLAYFSQESGESTLFEEEQAEPATEEPVSPFAEIPAPVEEGTGEENP